MGIYIGAQKVQVSDDYYSLPLYFTPNSELIGEIPDAFSDIETLVIANAVKDNEYALTKEFIPTYEADILVSPTASFKLQLPFKSDKPFNGYIKAIVYQNTQVGYQVIGEMTSGIVSFNSTVKRIDVIGAYSNVNTRVNVGLTGLKVKIIIVPSGDYQDLSVTFTSSLDMLADIVFTSENMMVDGTSVKVYGKQLASSLGDSGQLKTDATSVVGAVNELYEKTVKVYVQSSEPVVEADESAIWLNPNIV
jgi:hypothetical protein